MNERMKEKYSEWASLIAEQSASGLSQAEWCRRHDISRRQFQYYHLKLEKTMPELLKEAEAVPPSETQFVEIPSELTQSLAPAVPSGPAFIVRAPGFLIEVSTSASREQMKTLFEVITHAK